jgi:hypothetical protein
MIIMRVMGMGKIHSFLSICRKAQGNDDRIYYYVKLIKPRNCVEMN